MEPLHGGHSTGSAVAAARATVFPYIGAWPGNPHASAAEGQSSHGHPGGRVCAPRGHSLCLRLIPSGTLAVCMCVYVCTCVCVCVLMGICVSGIGMHVYVCAHIYM